MQLAQVNVARLRQPIDHPDTKEFVDALDPINALAEASPGFVWRLQDDGGDATAIQAYDDERIIVNLTVWTDADALADFAYRSDHTPYLRRRREWFEKPTEAIYCLWWVPDGHRPSVAEAVERLDHLRTHGPTEHSFTFREAKAAT